jgi:uncharacterized membrane protein YfcA
VPVVHRAHLHPTWVVVGVACVVGGHAIGSRAFARVEKHRFEVLLRAVVVCAGAASIAAGLAAMA